MESIEQLKQDNAKLTERLNNAAKFFREQKAQIELLTKENEELKVKSENFENVAVNKQKVIEKLESNIDSKEKAYKVLQDTYNEVFAEKEKITKQFKEQEKFESEVINTKVPELETKLKNSEAAYKELSKKYSELIELHDGDLKRYNELEDNYEGLQNKYKENDIAKGEAELRAQSLNDEYTKKFVEQENQIESLKKKFEKEGKNAIANKALLDEANENLEKLNKLYDNCENEKLAAQADYDALKEKYEELKINAVAYEEVARNYEGIIDEYEQMKFFMEALQKLTESVNITWKNVPQEEVNKLKEEVKVKTEPVKKSNKEGRIINQEMAVQGGMTINM